MQFQCKICSSCTSAYILLHLFASPPAGPETSHVFARSVIFLLDRSGSMINEPLLYAKSALATGLKLLTKDDEFTVVAFDHEQLWWTGKLTVLPWVLACVAKRQ